MINSVNSTQNINYSYAQMPVNSAPSNSTPVSGYTNDSFRSSVTSSSGGTEDPNNKQAGIFKKFGNFIGRTFDSMKDWVGLGTLSHFAKDNFIQYDANKNKSLDTNEFGAVSALINQSFTAVDKNQNGEISLGEFKKVAGQLLGATFDNLDTSKDGYLNLNEASAGGYVVTHGNHNSFVDHDKNQDQLLSFAEFAHLANSMKKMK